MKAYYWILVAAIFISFCQDILQFFDLLIPTDFKNITVRTVHVPAIAYGNLLFLNFKDLQRNSPQNSEISRYRMKITILWDIILDITS